MNVTKTHCLESASWLNDTCIGMVSSRRRLLELEDGLTPGMKRVCRIYGYNRGSGLIEWVLQLTREGWICNWYIQVYM